NAVRIGNLIYNSLLRADAHARLQPELAASWRSVDPATYEFELRRGVRFSDGRPLTGADVKFTYESMLEANSRSPRRAQLKPLQAIDLLDDYRLRFRLAAPHAPFVEQFTQGIVPAGSAAQPTRCRRRRPAPARSSSNPRSPARKSRSGAIRLTGTSRRRFPAWFSKSCPTRWCASSSSKKATSISCKTISSPT